jgi:hypothetical protein
MQLEYSGEAIRFQRGDQWAGMYETIKEVYQPQWEQEIRERLENEDKAKRIIAAKWRDNLSHILHMET